MTNYDYKHDYWKLNRDLSLKLKDEEERAAFFTAEDFEEFKAIMQHVELSRYETDDEIIQKLKSLAHLHSQDPQSADFNLR